MGNGFEHHPESLASAAATRRKTETIHDKCIVSLSRSVFGLRHLSLFAADVSLAREGGISYVAVEP
jgi:hypothetical protein